MGNKHQSTSNHNHTSNNKSSVLRQQNQQAHLEQLHYHQKQQQLDQHQLHLEREENLKKYNIKRRLTSNKAALINRSSSSPVIAKWRLSQQVDSNVVGQNEQRHSPLPVSEEICTLTRSPLTSRPKRQQQQQHPNSILELNREMKAKQESLTNVIKKIDSTHPSYQQTNSKLYRPDSFMNRPQPQQTTTMTPQVAPKKQHDEQPSPKHALPNRYERLGMNANMLDNKCSTLPLSHTTHDLAYLGSNHADNNNNNNFRTNQHHTLSNSNKNMLSKSKQNLSNGKLNKRFGLSPRFKRKIVETITSRVSDLFALLSLYLQNKNS